MIDFEKFKSAFKDMNASRAMKFMSSGLLSSEEMVALMSLVAFVPKLAEEFAKLKKGFAKFDMTRLQKIKASGVLSAAEFDAVEGVLELIQAVRRSSDGGGANGMSGTNGAKGGSGNSTEKNL
jgi:hypothetical protein